MKTRRREAPEPGEQKDSSPPCAATGDPEICRSFLELAISEFTWTKEYQVRYNHFDSDPSQWQQITERYPGVFQAGWTSLSRPDDLKMI